MRTRIKICGITRVEDGLAAIAAGADALGFVFYPKSPRAVTAEQAALIIDKLPPFVTTVALFVDQTKDRVEAIARQTRVDLLQFHGDETPEFCDSFGRPWIKAVRMKDCINLSAEAMRYSQARALLLDAWQPDVPGGTGHCFDWTRIPASLSGKIILAGGLNPDNVTQAVREVRPFAVDVSGGVEAARGIKDAEKMARFVRGVRFADE